MNPSIPELPAEAAGWLDLGSALGQNQTFGLMAGRCSAAQAVTIRSIRESKLYKQVSPDWREFCPRYLNMSRGQADHIIRLLDEFGPGYFELAELIRVSPETYRAIAPSVKDGVLRYQGNAIELTAENSRKVADAVAELRRTLPKKRPKPLEMHVRIRALDKQCTATLAEFAEIARRERCGENWLAFTSVLSRMATNLRRLEMECGVQ
jgi:hypothetical protein